MFVAELAHYCSGLDALERSFGSFAGLEKLTADSFAVDDFDPLDEVIVLHWVSDASDFDFSGVEDRDVLLSCRVSRVLSEELHRFAAT